jgi:hypothetical protein
VSIDLPNPLSADRKAYAERFIDQEVFTHRAVDFTRKFLPDGLTLVARLNFLNVDDVRLMSQIQGRTYVRILDCVERCIAIKTLESARTHPHVDESTVQGLLCVAQDKGKHQLLLQRLEREMIAMPTGYIMTAEANSITTSLLTMPSWSVFALICHSELYMRAHYEQSIAGRDDVCALFKDALCFRWRDAHRHSAFAELNWTGEHERLTASERDKAVEQFIDLLRMLDAVLATQARADTDYFLRNASATFTSSQRRNIESTIVAAYRWQYIVSGMQHVQFSRLLTNMTTPEQFARICVVVRGMMRG